MWILFPEVINFLWITYDSFCYCWSWKKYWDCCMKKAHEPWMTEEEFNIPNRKNYGWVIPPNIYTDSIFKLCNKCIICENPTIKSHTISSNWIRKSFNSNFISTVLPDKNWNMVLTKKPINKASIIPIRCEYHDNEIFKPIDNDINLKDNHHLNLLAYRALWREKQLLLVNNKISYTNMYYHNTAWNQLQHSEYYKRSNEMYLMTEYVENWIKSKTWEWLKHKIFELGKVKPIFLSSAFNSRNFKDWRKTQNVIMLSILTINNFWYLVVSYKEGEPRSKLVYEKINKNYKKWNFISFLNDLIWKNCENIICEESRAWEIIQTPQDGKIYENWAHDYIISIN